MKMAASMAMASAALCVGARASHAEHRRLIQPDLLDRPTLTVAGGVEQFIDTRVRDVAGIGETWSVRAAAGRPKGVRLELAYIGSTQSLVPSQGSTLTGHGAVAMMRVNVAPWVYPLEPFFYFGGGWIHYQATRSAGSMLHAHDDVLAMPIGFGVARELGKFSIDIRGGVDVAAGGDLVPVDPSPSTSRTSASMHRFALVAGVGVAL